MYQSPLDPLGKLTFEFDPFRLLHARKDSELGWPEYPFKQVLIDRVQARTKPKASVHATAAALLLAQGDETRALFELQQCLSDALIDEAHPNSSDSSGSGYGALEQRFRDERDAFRAAKTAFLKGEKAKVRAKLDAIARNDQEQAEQDAHEAWKRRQIVKRFEDGSKYDGDGVNRNNVLIPHGQGTLWVPEKESSMAESGNIKRVPRYIGAWVDGFMHGRGMYYWRNGDSWEGSFIRDEMHGKGVFLPAIDRDSDDEDETARPTTSNGAPLGRRIRYFDASHHVCWGDELIAGCRLLVATNRHFGDPLVTSVKRCNVDLEVETEYVIVSYDEKADRFLVRKGESEETQWLSLQNTSFRVARSRPITRWSPE